MERWESTRISISCRWWVERYVCLSWFFGQTRLLLFLGTSSIWCVSFLSACIRWRNILDDEGIAIILCEPELEHKYRTLTQGSTTLESSLHQNLAEHINSEIGLGTISTVESAKDWLRHSFLFRRIQKNPHHYDIGKHEKQTWEEKIDEIVMESILSLRDTQLIAYNEREGGLSSTEYGDVMSKVGVFKFRNSP